MVLVNPRNPLNIGAAARAMSNFGFSHLRVVNPYELAFREARSAVGATEILANAAAYKSVPAAVADCSVVVGTTAVRHRQVLHPIRRLSEARDAIRSGLQSGTMALLFGSEKAGLSKKDLSHCHWLLHVPTEKSHVSMNLGQAVAVCLYELVRNDSAPEHAEIAKRASAEATERITLALLDALRLSGYTNPRTADSSEDKVRRMLRRLNLSSADAELLLGMMRQISWKLGRETGKL
ncbi:MAG TPA: TrmH family RNA methyltransferase [Candidatus Sulfotelmatobacter sp.]|nr:TrmH family RNA methyltransferase [Candidatus Sulfotelmatobacter sp.]